MPIEKGDFILVDYVGKIKETNEFIIMDVFRNYKLSKKDIDKCLESGKKLIMRIFGSLEISSDVDPVEISEVIEKITVYGSVEGPRNVIKAIMDRFEVYGAIKKL